MFWRLHNEFQNAINTCLICIFANNSAHKNTPQRNKQNGYHLLAAMSKYLLTLSFCSTLPVGSGWLNVVVSYFYDKERGTWKWTWDTGMDVGWQKVLNIRYHKRKRFSIVETKEQERRLARRTANHQTSADLVTHVWRKNSFMATTINEPDL